MGTSSSMRTQLITLVCIVIVVAGGSFIYTRVHRSTGAVALSASYCNTQGDVCLAYPESWEEVKTAEGVSLTNSVTNETVVYASSDNASTVACAVNACLFTALTTVISNGFSNGDDVAGILRNKELNTYTPEYFLIATPELLHDGLTVGSTVALKQMFEPTFVNTTKATRTQSLRAIAGPSQSFHTLSGAQKWLRSADAQTAEAIINSAHRD